MSIDLKKVKEDFKTPYDAGFNAGLYGGDNFNSHYKWFMSKENMQEWERGKRNAEAKNEKPKNKKQCL